ncbi:MAG: universal stress protein [Chloroflexi bacterium]|nr:universal stress protein [Chloroflexota bacterium]
MYQKILAPLDGSEFSECSLAHVRAIATGCSVPEVIVLMSLETKGGGGLSENIIKEAKAAAEKYVAKVVAGLKKDGISAKGVIVSGLPDEQILKYADKNKVDLIIMSTHGRTGVARWAFGSVADSVVHNSKIPVLIASPSGCRVVV